MSGFSRNRALLAALGLLLLLAGCGGSAEDDTEPEAAEEPGADPETEVAEEAPGAGCTNDAILAEVSGMSSEEREGRLVELAADEGDGITLYATTGEDDLAALVEEFESRHGISADVFSATGPDILQRAMQEHQAGRVGGDVVMASSEHVVLLDDEGALAATDTPAAEFLIEGATYDRWYAFQFNPIVLLRNSDLVPDEDAPRTFEDLADYDGTLGVRFGNEDHMMAIVKYWQAEHGWTEEEGLDLWREILSGDNVRTFTSNGPLAEAVNIGELGLGIAFQFYQPRFARDGVTPMEWEPAAEPLVFRQNGVGVMCQAPNPAIAMLWQDFLLSLDGQTILGEVLERDVAHADVRSGASDTDEDYEIIHVHPEDWIAESDKWRGLFEEILGAPPAD